MMRVSPNPSPARWPFWLLLAAWFCANSPQAATYEVVVWLGSARHFSHQQRLTSDVASILGGADTREMIASASTPRERPFAPPLPAEATLKKIDLFVSVSSELIPPSARTLTPSVRVASLPATPWREPPSEPPRAV